MAMGKQAKVISDRQFEVALAYLSGRRHGLRNRVILLLSAKSGLRAKEIAGLRWSMVVDGNGEVGNLIHLPDEASKGRSGRVIPINKHLRQSFLELLAQERTAPRFDVGTWHLVRTERSASTTAQAVVNMFQKWHGDLGFIGCSSHSGRRTFITKTARKISTVGGSLRDVQLMAGHANLQTTQRYIDYDTECQRRVVDLV